MAVTDPKLSVSLALATQMLLAPAAADAAGFGLLPDDEWESEALLLVYSEPGRVSAIEPVVAVRRNLDTDEFLDFRLTLDTLTGASGTGATPWTEPQTFTRPSGNGNYTVAPGETPLDDTFHDTRVALSGGWTRPLTRTTTAQGGVSVSSEYDYLSLGVNGSLAHEFDRNNRTLSLGLAVANDTIDPVGGVPVAFQAMPASRRSLADAGQSDSSGTGTDGGGERAVSQAARDSSENKQVMDVLVGFTQVIDRQSLVQFNLGLGQVNGYQNDPYKFLSVLDADGNLVYANEALGLPLLAFENRPDSRLKQTFYTQYKRDFDGRVLDAAYRFGTDDWGIDSHTLELGLRMPFGAWWLKPTLRYYTQSAADFYKPYLLESALPEVGDNSRYATADYRLGALDTWTLGLTVGHEGRYNWNASIEYYLQQPGHVDSGGPLGDLDLAPEVDAILLRIGSSF